MPQDTDQADVSDTGKQVSPWRVCGWICAGVIALSVVCCLALSWSRSVALTQITVTALSPDTEPKGLRLPFTNQQDELPDYEIRLALRRGGTLRLGVKLNTSAVGGLTWRLNDPVSVASISTVQLHERDKFLSDLIREIEFRGDSVSENGFRFDFETERSFSTGMDSFAETPIGKAIAFGFLLAVLFILLSIFPVPSA